jgi:hypothetical protein
MHEEAAADLIGAGLPFVPLWLKRSARMSTPMLSAGSTVDPSVEDVFLD